MQGRKHTWGVPPSIIPEGALQWSTASPAVQNHTSNLRYKNLHWTEHVQTIPKCLCYYTYPWGIHFTYLLVTWFLPYKQIWTYPPGRCDVLNPYIYWYTILLSFTAAEYSEYDEWIEQLFCWDGTSEQVHTMTFKALTDANHNFLFCSRIRFTEEPMASNLRLESLCG